MSSPSDEQRSLFARVGQWFGIRRDGADLPLEKRAQELDAAAKPVRRFSFFRPWGQREEALLSMQQGFQTLTELMAAIRDNLEHQNRRQDEALNYLARLPEVLEEVPETQRIQGEALRLIGQQLQQQIANQGRLGEILDKLTDSHGDQRQILEGLHGRVDELSAQSERISENLRHFGSTVEGMGRTSESSATVLQRIHEDLEVRGNNFERVLQRQNTRFTVLLIVAIVLSALALAAVATAGFLLRAHLFVR